jgi:N-acetylglucosamine-6-phosphate deacetylase
MLCRLADEFGFKLGTFQHALEGYKVAEAIKKSALGASSFSDWWAYKFEVIDAIPYNGAIMHDVGVVVSFNSDSSELARRMNTEAGKAVKYGNLPPAEALKFVTINPAIQLGVEQRIGSLEKSKDADLAIWSGNPLSYRSRCEATYIDGCAYFTIERDLELRALAAKQRNRLLQAALAAKKVAKPDPGGKRRRSSRHHYIDKLFSCCEEVR